MFVLCLHRPFHRTPRPTHIMKASSNIPGIRPLTVVHWTFFWGGPFESVIVLKEIIAIMGGSSYIPIKPLLQGAPKI